MELLGAWIIEEEVVRIILEPQVHVRTDHAVARVVAPRGDTGYHGVRLDLNCGERAPAFASNRSRRGLALRVFELHVVMLPVKGEAVGDGRGEVRGEAIALLPRARGGCLGSRRRGIGLVHERCWGGERCKCRQDQRLGGDRCWWSEFA